jgi:cytochrome bd-type quinol oxidase subunit 2
VADIVEIARRELPTLQPVQLRYDHAGDANATVTVRGMTDSGTLSPFASVSLNASTGAVIHTDDPANATMGSTFYDGLVSLHFATFGGYVTRWLYFVLGLAGAFLFYSGNLLWIESRRRRRSPGQTRGAILLARLNSGVCIGCMAAVSAAFLASRGFTGMADRAQMTEWVYFAVFFLSIGWCFLRPVAAGTRDLLYLAAVLSAGIVLIDVATVEFSPWPVVLVSQFDLLMVDALAIIAALAFWRMGAAVQRRALRGDPNSVWAAQATGASPQPDDAGLITRPVNSVNAE